MHNKRIGNLILQNWKRRFCFNYGNTNSSRSLLSDTTTNLENYARQRMFKMDQLKTDGKVMLFRRLQALSTPKDARRAITSIIDSFHCAESNEDFHTVELAVKLLQERPEGECDDVEFYFGATLFRMYHFQGMPEKALALYRNPRFKKLCEDNTCHMLLMDLMYKHKQYHNVMHVFDGLRRFDTNCYTLAFGALYHINTSGSMKQSQLLLKKTQPVGNTLQRRAIMFSTMLALNQGNPKIGLDNLALCKPNNITRNIELICQSRLGYIQEVLRGIEEILIATEKTTRLMNHRIYQDTWSEIKLAVEKRDSPIVQTLRSLESKLCLAGLLSLQQTSVFLERTLPGDRDYKRERAKRSISRSKP